MTQRPAQLQRSLRLLHATALVVGNARWLFRLEGKAPQEAQRYLQTIREKLP